MAASPVQPPPSQPGPSMYSSGLEVVDGSQWAQQAPTSPGGQFLYPYKEVAPSNLPQYYFPRPDKETVTSPSNQYASTFAASEYPSEALDYHRRRRRNKWIWVAIGVLAIIIIAVLGSVLGVVLSRQDRSASSSADSDGSSTGGSGSGSDSGSGGSATTTASGSGSTSTASATSNNKIIHDRSGLASTNWTDPSGTMHYGIVYQHVSNALMLSHWDSSSETWSVVNVTAALKDDDPQPDAGTGLAVSVRQARQESDPFQLNVYFRDTDSNLQEASTQDADVKSWSIGGDLGRVRVADGSHFAAYWGPYWSDAWFQALFFQSPAGRLEFMYRNESQTEWTMGDDVTSNPASDTGFANCPYFEDREGYGEGMIGSRSYVATAEGLEERLGNNEAYEGIEWANGNALEANSAVEPADAAVSCISYGTDSWDNILVGFVQEGSIMLGRFESSSHTWTQAELEVTGAEDFDGTGVAGFAMHQDRKGYVILGDAISEFQVPDANANAFTWKFSSDVKVPA